MSRIEIQRKKVDMMKKGTPLSPTGAATDSAKDTAAADAKKLAAAEAKKLAAAKKRSQVLTFGIMQYLDERHWAWSDAEKQQYFTNAASILHHICERIYNGLAAAGETGDDLKFEFAGITHDKDTTLMFDPRLQTEVISPIDEHIHAVVTLSKKRDISVIAQWVGLQPQFVEAPKKGRYGRENMLAYLIHAKQPDKYQYHPSEVQTFGTFDYMAYWVGRKVDWDKHKATVQTKNNKVSSHWLVKQVQEGLIDKRQIMRNPVYASVYADNMPLINDAIQFYGEKKGFDMLDALENGEFELSVIFVTGSPGAGKTFFALELAKALSREHGWGYYPAASANGMDDYNGEEILILDDFRAGSLSASAWIQMLDPRTAINMSARYKNKKKAYRTLIITSHQEPYTFFSHVGGAENEAIDQFIRRIMMNVQIYRVGNDPRQVEVEAIGRTTTPILYDLSRNKFITGNYLQQGIDTHPNGLPKHPDAFASIGPIDTRYYFSAKEVNFAPFSIFTGSFESAQEFIVNVIRDKNDPDKKHNPGERPVVGNVMPFWNYNPELSCTLGLNMPKKPEQDID